MFVLVLIFVLWCFIHRLVKATNPLSISMQLIPSRAKYVGLGILVIPLGISTRVPLKFQEVMLSIVTSVTFVRKPERGSRPTARNLFPMFQLFR